MKSQPYFTVDRRGLAKLVERRGDAWLASIVLELYQNAVDNDGVTHVSIDMEPTRGRPTVVVRVTDDHPEGFADLAAAWTLFAESERKGDPTKRGRFCMGEKLVAAIASSMTIETTKGTVTFDESGRTVSTRSRRDAGSCITVMLRATREQVQIADETVLRIIAPEGVRVVFCGDDIPHRTPDATVRCALPTEVSDDDGVLRRRVRETVVRAYEPRGGEAWLYELGIPVMALPDDRFDLDVGQKIPLTMERDNVPESYLRTLRVHVANALADRIGEADGHRPWVRDALSDSRATEAMVRAAITARFGPQVVTYDLRDVEANKAAVAAGYTVVKGAHLSAAEWQSVKRTGVLQAAGKVAPTMRVNDDLSAITMILAPSDWTPGMRIIAAYTKLLALEFGVGEVSIDIEEAPSAYFAVWHKKSLAFNVTKLGRDWFDRAEVAIDEAHDNLILHELGHDAGGHLDASYHAALTRFGARLRRVADRCEAKARAQVREESRVTAVR